MFVRRVNSIINTFYLFHKRQRNTLSLFWMFWLSIWPTCTKLLKPPSRLSKYRQVLRLENNCKNDIDHPTFPWSFLRYYSLAKCRHFTRYKPLVWHVSHLPKGSFKTLNLPNIAFKFLLAWKWLCESSLASHKDYHFYNPKNNVILPRPRLEDFNSFSGCFYLKKIRWAFFFCKESCCFCIIC